MIVQSMPYPATTPTVPGVTVNDGVWTWFSNPRAMVVGGDTIVNAVTAAGRIGVYQPDGTFTDLRGSLFQQDDHAVPSGIVRSGDGKVQMFAAAHNGGSLYTYVSTSANDVSAFGSETVLSTSLSDYSYANPIQLGDGTIFVFFRATASTDLDWYYVKSTDGGSTWASPVKFLSNNGDYHNGPYNHCVKNGASRIDFCCNDNHPVGTATNSVYHFYYDHSSGTFKKTDGTALTLPILPSTDLTKV
jgi:hypothetical protein